MSNEFKIKYNTINQTKGSKFDSDYTNNLVNAYDKFEGITSNDDYLRYGFQKIMSQFDKAVKKRDSIDNYWTNYLTNLQKLENQLPDNTSLNIQQVTTKTYYKVHGMNTSLPNLEDYAKKGRTTQIVKPAAPINPAYSTNGGSYTFSGGNPEYVGTSSQPPQSGSPTSTTPIWKKYVEDKAYYDSQIDYYESIGQYTAAEETRKAAKRAEGKYYEDMANAYESMGAYTAAEATRKAGKNATKVEYYVPPKKSTTQNTQNNDNYSYYDHLLLEDQLKVKGDDVYARYGTTDKETVARLMVESGEIRDPRTDTAYITEKYSRNKNWNIPWEYETNASQYESVGAYTAAAETRKAERTALYNAEQSYYKDMANAYESKGQYTAASETRKAGKNAAKNFSR